MSGAPPPRPAQAEGGGGAKGGRGGAEVGLMLMLSYLVLIDLNCFKEATKVYTKISFRQDHRYKYSLNSLNTVK